MCIRDIAHAAALAGALAAGAGGAELRLELQDSPPFQAGDAVTVVVSMADLGGFEAVGFQAFLAFDTAELDFVAGSYLPEPFGLPVIPIIVAVGEDIDMASGIDVFNGQEGTSDDSDLATLVFEAVTDLCLPSIVFRDHEPPPRITDDTGTPAEPLDLVTIAAVADCNGNGVEDVCDIVEGDSRDCNANGVPDECETLTCPADFSGAVPFVPDGVVDIFDFLDLLASWGPDGCADFSGAVLNVPDGVVDIFDFLHLLAAWGPCP